MATTLTPITTSRAGVAWAPVAADATGNNWVNTGKEVLFITNGGGSAITVTLAFNTTTQAQIDGQSPASRTVSVPAGASRLIGPFPTTFYNDATVPNGRMNVTYSAVTSVTVLVEYTGT